MWAQPSLEQVLFHICSRGDLNSFLVEPLDICSEGLFFPLNDGLEGGFRLWSVAGCDEVSRKYPSQLLPRSYGFAGEALVPGHGSFPQGGREQSALDGAPDAPVVEQGIDVLDAVVGISGPVILPEGRRLFQALGESCVEDLPG